MSGNDFDKSRVSAALEVVKQHPGMALLLASPVLVVFVLVWWLVSPVLAVILLSAVIVGGVFAIGRGGSNRSGG